MTRLLYISPGPVPPSPNEANDQFSFLSEIAEGEILLPVWWRSRKQVSPYLEDSFPIHRVRNFRYHMFLMNRWPSPVRRLARFMFYLRRGLQLHRKKKFDVIMCYGTNLPGVAAVILKWVTGAKLIAEIPNVPEDSYRYQYANGGKWATVKRLLADRLLSVVGKQSDCLKLGYPWQLKHFPRLKHKQAAAFHFFVPVHMLAREPRDDKYVLLLGFPWYTKGVDILIRAFRSIAPQFPEFKLKLMGHYPDRIYLEELARGCAQIEMLYPQPNETALDVIAGCSVYVLASRTDAAPRVLLEAMAARKPIIASAVGGIPQYIADNDNGLLFESENVEELAAKLQLLLSSPELRERLASRGYQRATTELDERAFVKHFQTMLDSLNCNANQHFDPMPSKLRMRSS